MPKITIIDGVNEIELSTAPKENIKAYMVKGESGSDGVSPTASVSKTGGTTTITITDKNGTTEEDVKDGFNPTVTTSRNGNVTTVTITDINGTRTTDIADGIDMTGGVPTDGVIGWTKNELIYACDGTESGDYYLTYNSNDYYFTMPTVEEGDILVFSIDDLELSLDGTTITTASTGTGTELTFVENIPNGYEVSEESIATLTNTYSNSTEEGYSCKYFNDNVPIANDIYSTTAKDTYNCLYLNTQFENIGTETDTKISNLSKNLLPMPYFFSATTVTAEIPLNLTPGTYTISGDIGGSDMNYTCLFQFVNTDGTLNNVYMAKGTKQSVTFTAGQDIQALYIYTNSYYNQSLNRNANYYNIQIEKGSEATEYVEYNNKGIIESGSTTNGDYIYYADGTLICTKNVTGTAQITATWGALYDSGNSPVNFGNWAKSFIERPKISIQFIGGNGQWVEGIANASNTFIGNITLASATSKTPNINYDVIGIGRWRPYTFSELS